MCSPRSVSGLACRHDPDGRDRELTALLDELIEYGVNVECCSACARKLCVKYGGNEPDELMRPGIEIVGLASFAARAAQGVQTISF